MIASWEEQHQVQSKLFAVIDENNKNGTGNSNNGETAPDKSCILSRKRRRSAVASADSQGKEHKSDGTTRRLREQRTRHIIADGSSEAKDDKRAQASKEEESQTTLSTGASSLQSPPPEIEDSQAALQRERSTITVIVPSKPSESQREQFIPVSSGFEFESSSQIPTTFEVHSSGEVVHSDYPTPGSEQIQSPVTSDRYSPLFYSDIAQHSPKRSPLGLQTQRQNSASPFAASRLASEVLTTQITSSWHVNSVQVRASGEVSETQQDSAPRSLPSAQAHIGSTSPIHETQASLGEELTTLDRISDLHTPLSQKTNTQQSQASTATSLFKTQISPSQPPKRRLFRTLHAEGIESWSSKAQDAAIRRLQSPLRSLRPHLGRPDRPSSVGLGSRSSSSVLSHRPFSSPLAAMTTPSHRSSPRTGGAATPSKTSRGTTMTLQEQLALSRASRQIIAASASPVEAPTRVPVIPQIREPAPVQLTTRTSNPALPKVEMPDIESSSGMQVDLVTTSAVPSGSAPPNGKDRPSTSSLQIQESIERDEPEKADHSTQDSSILDSSEVQENGHVNSSNQGLMPNYPILLPGEFAIPLHAEGKTQDAYRDAVQAKQKAMSKYLRRGSSSSTPSSSGLITPKTEANEMAELVGKLDAIVSLLDLGYEGMLTQSSFSGTQLARWTVKASSKFAFIKTLIDTLQLYECSLIIFARAGQTQQLFEHFLSTFDVDHHTYTGSGEAVPGATSQGKVTVHLITGGQKPHLELKTGPSLIIAFDNSYDPRSEYVLNLRGEGDKQLPVIHLLVSNSSEHIERCLPVNMPSPQRNRLLMQSILQGSRHMGKILSEMNEATLEYYSHLAGGTRIVDDDLMRREQVFQKMPDFHLKRLAQQVGKALIYKEFNVTWSTVPPMPPLELDEIPGLITLQFRLPSPSPMPASPIGTPSLRKRLLDGDVLDTPGGSKRQRMTPVPGASPHEHSEAAQIHQLQHALKAAKDEAANEKLVRMGAEDARDKARSQLSEWRQSVGELQKRVEYHRDQDHKARTKIKQLTKDAERFNQLRERDASERDALKSQNKQLRDELASARKALLDAGGDTAALELAQAEARTASTALAKAEKDLASAKQQGEYFRVQYQETMATGRQHQADAEELQARVKDLEIDASDEKRRLKLVNFDDAANAHMQRIERLELENKVLESMVRKLNAENFSLKGNRGVSTRASSVQPPGSPRAREAKSRGGSPVPGLIGAGYSGSRASALRHERQ